jgi:hypothetical protein
LDARDDVEVRPVGLVRPQAPDRSSADRLEELQSWGAVQEPGFLAAIGDGFGEQVDEPVVRSVDAAGNV